MQLPFGAVRVGVADDPAGPTGCTVVAFNRAMRIARDVRGGSACWSGDFTEVHALCLAGGSVYGLEALSGVAAELLKERGGRVHWSDFALTTVSTATDKGPMPRPLIASAVASRSATMMVTSALPAFGASSRR